MSRHDGAMWIDRADPRIMISLEMLDNIICGRCRPGVTIRVRDENYCGPGAWLGAVIRIEAANRTVLYRLTEKAADGDAVTLGYVAEWPD